MKGQSKIILALDVDSEKKAMRWVNLLYPKVKMFKVGLELYTACGPKILQRIGKKGAGTFLDLKFHDIPNTMVNAVKEALRYKVAMLTVHTLAGPEALKAVAKSCRRSKTKVLGVTVLTSLSAHFLQDLGIIKRKLSDEVLYLAKMAKTCGLDGVVCSVKEAATIRERLGRNFLIATPGIRPERTTAYDQKRVATAKEAVKGGADFLIVGRPILEAKDPFKVLEELSGECYGRRD